MTKGSLRKQIEDPTDASLSISKQCALIGIPRSTYYYKPVPESAYNLELMKRIDEQYLERPFYGSRQMTAHLRQLNYLVNRKRVQNLMRKMGLEAIYQKPNLSKRADDYLKFPYLLTGLKIDHPNHVWGADITYIPVDDGYLYLIAILDLFSRYVVSWQLSNSLESDFCLEALEKAFASGKPEIFNTDQGAQFTSKRFVGCLQRREIQVSMDGKGRYWDNIFVERLWRSVKYEEVYLKQYEDGKEALAGLRDYFYFYNHQRPHQSLGYCAPSVYYQGGFGA
jgi:putative transposase